MRVAISESASGDHEVVAAPTDGRHVRILGYFLSAADAVSVTWKSDSTELTGAMSMIAGRPHVLRASNALDPLPLLECAHGEALVLTLSDGVQVSGWLIYDVIA